MQAAFLCFLVCIVALFPREYIETSGGRRSPEGRAISASVAENLECDKRNETRDQSSHTDAAVIEMVAFKAAEQEEQQPPQQLAIATRSRQLPATEGSHRRRTVETGEDARGALGWRQAPYPARTRALVTLLL